MGVQPDGAEGGSSPPRIFQIAIFRHKFRQYSGKTTSFSCKQWKNIFGQETSAPLNETRPVRLWLAPLSLCLVLWDDLNYASLDNLFYLSCIFALKDEFWEFVVPISFFSSVLQCVEDLNLMNMTFNKWLFFLFCELSGITFFSSFFSKNLILVFATWIHL